MPGGAPRDKSEVIKATCGPRRSSRLKDIPRRPLLEDPYALDPEFGDLSEMESNDSYLPPTDDAAAEGTNTTVLRSCSVVLDRLAPVEDSGGRELEEREEAMGRKGAKPLVSRIPTFQSSLGKKRPTGGSHNAEAPLSKKDPPLSKKDPPAEREEKALFADGPKSKFAGEREPAAAHHPQPLGFLSPRSEPEPAPPAAHGEQATERGPASPAEGRGHPEPGGLYNMTPRPSLRANPRVQEISPELSQEPEEAPPLDLTPPPEDADAGEGEGAAPARWTGIRAAGDGDTRGYREDTPPAAAAAEPSDPGWPIDIQDEVPPWESEPTKYDPELEDIHRAEPEVRDPQPVRDDAAEKPTAGSACESVGEVGSGGAQGPLQGKALRQRSTPAASRSYRSELPKATKPPALSQRAPAVKPSSPSAKRSGCCCSFVLFCLLPAALLLVGGLGQHLWHYGPPRSVAHLLAQLELHCQEGLVSEPCSTDCRVSLVESVPVGLSEPSALPSISDSWLRLLARANGSLDIAGFYVVLRDSRTPGQPDPSDAQGRKVFEELTRLPDRGVKLQIVVNKPQSSTVDTDALVAAGAEVRELDLQAVSGGILHTKLWVVNRQHLYLGSANMDWRSLSQVKEVGLTVEDCGCLAEDASRIFGVYSSLAGESNGTLPPYWPARFSALSSSQHPLNLSFNGVPARVYLSSAPPQISARGRTDDLSAILSVIADARQFVHISVMDFLPFSEFSQPARFWPDIDSALREAACARGVEVRLLASCWPHSPPAMFVFLQSLQVLQRPPLSCRLAVKVFTVPSTREQLKIPFARVNHAKYMVTDRVAYIGTSNWSENYFVKTAGVGLVVNQTGAGPGQATLQAQLDQVFLRDWSSSYATALPDYPDDVICPLLRH